MKVLKIADLPLVETFMYRHIETHMNIDSLIEIRPLLCVLFSLWFSLKVSRNFIGKGL